LPTMCILCPSEPPAKVSAKGSKGAQYGMYLAAQNNPNQFALPLKDACCTEPLCCIAGGCGAPCGCTSCWSRKAVLDTYYKGMDDFTCFQGYFDNICCCIKPSTMCACLNGSPVGLCLEGCCCSMLSVSVARIHLMSTKGIRPDPCDYQIIQCSNFLQLISCIFDIAAMFFDPLREAALILDIIADLFTYSVMGCMGAQIYHEVNKDKGAGKPIVQGQAVAQPIHAGGPVFAESMER